MWEKKKAERQTDKITINYLHEISAKKKRLKVEVNYSPFLQSLKGTKNNSPKLSKWNLTFMQSSANCFLSPHSSKLWTDFTQYTITPKNQLFMNPKLNHEGEGHSSELDCLDQCLWTSTISLTSGCESLQQSVRPYEMLHSFELPRRLRRPKCGFPEALRVICRRPKFPAAQKRRHFES